MSRAAVRAKAAELLDFAQLTDRAADAVDRLSGGMKRRLTIARSLVNDPELMLYASDGEATLSAVPRICW